MALGALNIHLTDRKHGQKEVVSPSTDLQSQMGDMDASECPRFLSEYLGLGLLLQVLRADVLQLQLVGQSQDLDVGGRQTRVVPRLFGELRH